MIKNAFTLVETVVVVAITTLILITLSQLIVYFYQTNAYTMQESTAVWQARRGIEDAMLHLREASYGSDGSYPIAVADATSIKFYANVDTSSSIEEVTYRVISGVLYRTVAAPIGNPPTYTGATAATTTIASSVTNDASTPIFRYFDNTGTELTAPIDIYRIASVKTTIVIDVDINRAPVAFTLSGGATLRNLRNQL